MRASSSIRSAGTRARVRADPLDQTRGAAGLVARESGQEARATPTNPLAVCIQMSVRRAYRPVAAGCISLRSVAVVKAAICRKINVLRSGAAGF